MSQKLKRKSNPVLTQPAITLLAFLVGAFFFSPFFIDLSGNDPLFIGFFVFFAFLFCIQIFYSSRKRDFFWDKEESKTKRGSSYE